IFAVINVESVTVDYLFGTAQWPLVLIILASALVGGLVVGGFGIFRVFRMRREIRVLTKKNQQLQSDLEMKPGMEDNGFESMKEAGHEKTQGEETEKYTREAESSDQTQVQDEQETTSKNK